MKLCQDYLLARGITDETIRVHGLELDDRLCATTIRSRLGRRVPKGANELIWFPLPDAQGMVCSYIARILPEVCFRGRKFKFLCPRGSGGPPYIPKSVFNLAPGRRLIITEGPVKALACVQAGCAAIGLNGVYGAAAADANGEYRIRADLLSALDWRGRQVYLAFDADLLINPKVRQALFRTLFVLKTAGAEVYHLSWDLKDGKGIDDYLVGRRQANGQSDQATVLAGLIKNAKPLIEMIQPNPLDLGLITSELKKVYLPDPLRDQLCRDLAKRLNVSVETLRAFKPQPPAAQVPAYAADTEPWPKPVNALELFAEIMLQIRKEVLIDEPQLYVAALEVFLTWVHEQMDFSPILFITAPTKECGKTQLLKAIGKMARRPLKTSSCSPAALYRLCEINHPTFLVDEAQDALKNIDFCTILKAGHDPTDRAIRCDPQTLEPIAFDVFCPKVLAGIGRGPAQIMSRSVIIEMERRDGKVDSSLKADDPVLIEIRRKLARWDADAGDLRRFHLPDDVARMRQRDNWEVFYRVASAIDSSVAEELVKKIIPLFVDEEQDFDTYLLASLRQLYRRKNLLILGGHMASEMILINLNNDKEAPWFKDESKGITREKLASRLRRYKVKPTRPDHNKARGYYYIDPKDPRNSLKRLFDAYLPPEKTP